MESEVFLGLGSAADMIRANGEAEAKEADRLRNENESYRAELEELRNLYLKNSKLVDEMRELCRQQTMPVQNLDAEESAAGRTEQLFTDLIAASDESTHKDCVRLYRNVQSVLISELDRQTKDLETSINTLQQEMTDVNAALRGIQEEQLNRPKEKKDTSPFTVLTFVMVLVMLILELSECTGAMNVISALLGM